jgi:hypothetical protein
MTDKPIFTDPGRGPARMLALMAVAGVVAAFGGYALGHAGAKHVASERAAGAREGRAHGAAVGRQQGYGPGLAAGKRDAYERAYRETYQDTVRRGLQGQ